MSEKEFDKIFRDKLENLSSPVPEDMWQRIHGEKDKDRKVFFLPWLLVAAMLILVVSVWVVVKNSNTSVKQNASVINKEQKKSTHQSPVDNNTNQNSVVANGESAAEKSQSEIADYSSRKNTNANVLASNSFIRNHQNKNQNQTVIEQSFTQQNNNSTNSEQQSLQSNNEATSSTENALENAVKDFTIDSKKLAAESSSKTDSAIGKALEENEKADKQSKDDDGDDLTLEIFASPEWPFISTSPNYNSGYSATTLSYVAQKKSSESSKLSFSFGFNVSKKFGKHVSIKTGLRYLRINEKFSYNKSENRYVPFIGNRYVTDINGNLMSVTDTLSMLAYGYRKISSLNTFKTLSIPLLVSYETGGKNLNFAFTAGPVLNLYTVFDGKTLDPYTFSAIPINSGNIYKTGSALGVYAGISASKKVYRNIQIFAEPHVQYNFGDITQPSAPFKQKVHTAGVSFGLKYNLSNRQH